VQYKLLVEVKDKDYERTLVRTFYEIPVVIGLISFGVDCGWNLPSVNTRVPHYRDWIQSVMNEELGTQASEKRASVLKRKDSIIVYE
jgi:secreted trypsin-like serine protease